MKIGPLIFMKPTVTHLNDAVDGQVDDDIDNKEGEYGRGYAHMFVQGTDTNTPMFLDYTKYKY